MHGNESKLRRFAASIPRDKFLDLIPRIESGRIVLVNPLVTLLRSCAERVAGPDEEVRKRSLLVCLHAIHIITKHPNLRVPDLDYARANLADIGLMRALWGDSDTAIRVTSRSICALFAKQVVRQDWFFGSETQLRWLHEVIESTAVYSADPETKNRLNFKSFVRGVLSTSNQEGDLSTEDETSFKETLAILLDVGSDARFDRDIQNQRRISEEVGWMHWDDPEGSGDVVNKLRAMFPFLPEHFPPPQAPPHV